MSIGDLTTYAETVVSHTDIVTPYTDDSIDSIEAGASCTEATIGLTVATRVDTETKTSQIEYVTAHRYPFYPHTTAYEKGRSFFSLSRN